MQIRQTTRKNNELVIRLIYIKIWLLFFRSCVPQFYNHVTGEKAKHDFLQKNQHNQKINSSYQAHTHMQLQKKSSSNPPKTGPALPEVGVLEGHSLITYTKLLRGCIHLERNQETSS